jgi:hypothetical protein
LGTRAPDILRRAATEIPKPAGEQMAILLELCRICIEASLRAELEIEPATANEPEFPTTVSADICRHSSTALRGVTYDGEA